MKINSFRSWYKQSEVISAKVPIVFSSVVKLSERSAINFFTCASAAIASSVAADERTSTAVIVVERRQLAAACKPVATSITTIAADEPATLAAQHTLPIVIGTELAVVACGSQLMKIAPHRADLSWRGSGSNWRHQADVPSADSRPDVERGFSCAFLYVSYECLSRVCCGTP